MLRVSSPGLRCYLHAWHFISSKQSLTVALKFGQQLRHAASDSPYSVRAMIRDSPGVDRSARRARPPHLKGHEDHDWDHITSPAQGGDSEGGEGDVQTDVHSTPIPNYPTGNRRRAPVRPLRRASYLPPLPSMSADDHERRFRSDDSAADSPGATHGEQETPRADPDDPYHEKRVALLDTLAKTDSASEAWEAYHALMDFPRNGTRLPVPWEHLHRLTRLISSIRPRTRPLFLRLLAVVSTIHRTGGTVSLWQWNALLDFAGKGFRRTRLEAYKNSLDMYGDLDANLPPGTTFMQNAGAPAPVEVENEESSAQPALKPDVYTLTTLLNIAAKTLDGPTLVRAWNLFSAHGVTPNRVTYIALITYYTKVEDLSAVRHIIHTMRLEGMELGLDGLNQCICSFMRLNCFATSEAIYNILRHNLTQDPQVNIHRVKRYLAGQHLMIPPNAIPDAITYLSLLQPYAYHGSFKPALRVFHDMVSHLSSDESYSIAQCSLPAYRSFFSGFYRWGAVPPSHLRSEGPYRYHISHDRTEESDWTLDALQTMFDTFLTLDGNFQPSDRMMYWILMAFARTSGNDLRILRKVFERLKKFKRRSWGGRMLALEEKLYGC